MKISDARRSANAQYDQFQEWDVAVSDLQKLAKRWRATSPQAQRQFVHLLEEQGCGTPNMDIVWHGVEVRSNKHHSMSS